MDQRTVRLSTRAARWASAQVAAGRFASIDEVVEAAMEMLEAAMEMFGASEDDNPGDRD